MRWPAGSAPPLSRSTAPGRLPSRPAIFDVDQALGCKITPHISDWQVGPFPTAAVALRPHRPARRQDHDSRRPGDRTADVQTYLLQKDGRGYGLAETSLVDSGYIAALTQKC
jgi:hypothetical protein